MRDTQLFQLALGINSPWFVSASDFDDEKRRLDIEIDIKTGARFACPDCRTSDFPVHDIGYRTPVEAHAAFGSATKPAKGRPAPIREVYAAQPVATDEQDNSCNLRSPTSAG